MAHPTLGKRKRDDRQGSQLKSRIVVKQRHYSSSGSEGRPSRKNVDSNKSTKSNVPPESEAIIDAVHPLLTSRSHKDPAKLSSDRIVISDKSSNTSSEFDSDTETQDHRRSNSNNIRIYKRNDPSAFANSISTILSSRLTSTRRADPVLARSTIAAQANSELASAKLEAQAKGILREAKTAKLEKGHVKDVLLGTDAVDVRCVSNDHPRVMAQTKGAVKDFGYNMQESQELEKRLRKTAQRGVVKLFNAVRQAQLRAEEASKERGGRSRKEEKAGEMSRKGFLEMVAGR